MYDFRTLVLFDQHVSKFGKVMSNRHIFVTQTDSKIHTTVVEKFTPAPSVERRRGACANRQSRVIFVDLRVYISSQKQVGTYMAQICEKCYYSLSRMSEPIFRRWLCSGFQFCEIFKVHDLAVILTIITAQTNDWCKNEILHYFFWNLKKARFLIFAHVFPLRP